MKSTIRKAYEVIDNPDGSKIFTFMGNHFDYSTRYKIIGTIPAFLICTGLIFFNIFDKIPFLAIACWVGSLIVYLWFALKKRKYVISLDKNGISYEGGKKFIAWADYRGLAVSGQNAKNKAAVCICIKALGNEVRICGYGKYGMIDAIADDIVAYNP